jgi:pimeloyl-ACP methyl ester carboxylesterase
MQQRHFRWYGAESGRTVVYFHGAPGAAIECGRFHEAARANGVRLVGLERSSTDIRLAGEAYFERHAGEVAAIAGDGPFAAIGFSLGAFVALRTAPYLQDRLTRLDLVSAAAPLESGDFLKAMAGRAVFDMARRSPKSLRRLARLEAWLALRAPSALFAMLFGNLKGADRALAADPTFRAEIEAVLRLALETGTASFTRDVVEYVRPWAERLAEVTVPTHIWHGAEDNRAPPAMAASLERLIPRAAGATMLAGLSHYSCLHASVPRILSA